MIYSYAPIMKAKTGEFDALKSLRLSVLERIIPIFELPAQPPEKIELEKTICNTAIKAGKAWQRVAMLDISKWKPNAQTENSVHILEYAFSQFRENGVIVHPVIGYDRWDDPAYQQALKNIFTRYYKLKPCIRFDKETIQEDMLDIDYFQERISGIMETLDINAGACYALIDFGDVSKAVVPNLIDDAENAINILRDFGFDEVIIAGGSMPIGVNEAVKMTDTEGCVPRIEMQSWKAIFSKSKDTKIIFSDYSIRNPDAAEDIIALDANAKIRYTVNNQYFIVRGHSKRKDLLGIQNKNLASRLIASNYYMGSSFSWGDSELLNCSIGQKQIKSLTTMVAIDTNHHIHAVVTEIFEHQRIVFVAPMKTERII